VFNKKSVLNTRLKHLRNDVSLIPLFDEIYKKIKCVQISEEEKKFIEYFFIKTTIYYILHSGRDTNYKMLKVEAKKLFSWIEEKYPQYRNNPNKNPFKPKGEDFFVRLVIYLYIILKHIGLENLFLKFYSKFPK